ncbi:MAG: hypothetical protein ACUVQZ_08370 [Candidatus Caldatribacteriaceae bacterium]
MILETEQKKLQEKFPLEIRIHNPEEVVILIKEYLKEHFQENLSLSFIAQKFHYNSAYLSRILPSMQGLACQNTSLIYASPEPNISCNITGTFL